MNIEDVHALRMRFSAHPTTIYLRLMDRGRFGVTRTPMPGAVEVGTYTRSISSAELHADILIAKRELRAMA